jgi:hypothetical protein
MPPVARGVYAATVATATLDCPFSLYPVNHPPVGTEVYCPACDRKVGITLPPPRGFRDPWPGDKRARVTPHWPPQAKLAKE